ncbi:MAG TPA: PilN domain-containing protein [Tepidisphaeraceae bacterium]
MREIELIPEWYVAHSRQKRLLRLQVYAVLTLLLSLATWGLVTSQAIDAAQAELQEKRIALELSAGRVRERQTQQQLREQLQTQERVDVSLGLNIEASRLLAMIDQAMPSQGSLIEVSIDTEEKPRTLAQFAASKSPTSRATDRRLRVNLKGVAPTNGDIATILEKLGQMNFCEELRLSYARDRTEKGHVMREFVVEFSIDLNTDGSAS